MFYTKSDRMFTENAEGREGSRVPMHNTEDHGERPHQPEEASSSSSGLDTPHDGTWGERDVGGPVNFRNAMLDYEEMRRELTHLSKTRSGKSAKTTKTNKSEPRRVKSSAQQEQDVEAQGEEEKEAEDEEEDFELGDFLKDGHFEKRQEGRSAKKVGVVYKNLTVQGVGATSTFVKTLPGAVIGVRSILSENASDDADHSHLDFRPRLV